LFQSSVLDQTKAITQLHTETKDITISEHEKTRSILLSAVRGVDVPRKDSGSSGTDQELETRRRTGDRILRSLRIDSISERYNRIVEAHAATFQWIFTDPAAEDRPWSDFAQWLKSGNGIYWINGKAGSGKSTLMRYIYDRGRTADLLGDWAAELPLTIASFFFWNSGTPDQRSQNGLLRCLIYEVLSQNRDLMPIVVLNQWQEQLDTDRPLGFRWQRHELRAAFESLRTQNQTRICLFIDGLDEYEGDKDGTYEEIISFFIGLVRSPNIKICLSSRPWLIFEDAFRRSPSLKLQD
jgi:hypothetical protein